MEYNHAIYLLLFIIFTSLFQLLTLISCICYFLHKTLLSSLSFFLLCIYSYLEVILIFISEDERSIINYVEYGF